MSLTKLFALFLCLCLTQANFYYDEGGIIGMGEINWNSAMDDFANGIIVLFYEGHNPVSQVALAEFRALQPKLTSAGSGAKLGMTECFDEFRLCYSRGVYHYPTVVLYRKGQSPLEYRGSITANDLADWTAKVVDLKLPTINDEATLFKRASIAVLFRDQGSKLATDISKTYTNLVEVAIGGGAFQNKFNGAPAIIISQGGEVFPIKQGEDVTTVVWDKISKILKNTAPVLSNNIFLDFQNDETSKDLVLFFRTKSYNGYNDAAKAFDKVNKELSTDKMVFAYVNVDDGDLLGKNLATQFRISEKDQPTVVIISKIKKVWKKYKFEGAIQYENLKEFIQNFLQGQAKRFFLSAEASNVGFPLITTLVASIYDKVTKDTTKNVLVVTENQNCRSGADKLLGLAEVIAYRFRNRKDFVVARIDTIQNDVEELDSVEHPALLFYSKSGNSFEVYQSERTISSIKNFLIDRVPELKADLEL